MMRPNWPPLLLLACSLLAAAAPAAPSTPPPGTWVGRFWPGPLADGSMPLPQVWGILRSAAQCDWPLGCQDLTRCRRSCRRSSHVSVPCRSGSPLACTHLYWGLGLCMLSLCILAADDMGRQLSQFCLQRQQRHSRHRRQPGLAASSTPNQGGRGRPGGSGSHSLVYLPGAYTHHKRCCMTRLVVSSNGMLDEQASQLLLQARMLTLAPPP